MIKEIRDVFFENLHHLNRCNQNPETPNEFRAATVALGLLLGGGEAYRFCGFELIEGKDAVEVMIRCSIDELVKSKSFLEEELERIFFSSIPVYITAEDGKSVPLRFAKQVLFVAAAYAVAA